MLNKLSVLSLFLFLSGILFFVLGFLEGDVEGGFFVVFPFVMGSGLYAFLGVLCFFVAFLFFMSSFSSDVDGLKGVSKKSSFKTGGVVFIGPVPIVFGSSWRVALLMMLVGFVVMLILFFLFFW